MTAEGVIKGLYSEVGWNVAVEWRSKPEGATAAVETSR